MSGRFVAMVSVCVASLSIYSGGAVVGQPTPPPPCVVPNVGGTVVLPPAGCNYLSPDDVHNILIGLPAGTHVEFGPDHQKFLCRQGGPPCLENGGTLGGQIERFDSILVLDAQGFGAPPFNTYSRTFTMQVQTETHTAPRTPGQPVQDFATDMFSIEGQITGDPVFDLLRFVGGTDYGFPSPGLTRLTLLSTGQFRVDSFFDITYEMTFQGAPGGIFAGMSGTTMGTLHMAAGFGLFDDGFESGDTSSWSTAQP